MIASLIELAISQEDWVEKTSFYIATACLVGIVAIFTGSLFLSIDNNADTCALIGYQEHIERNGRDYCVTFGLEPEIVLVDSADE